MPLVWPDQRDWTQLAAGWHFPCSIFLERWCPSALWSVQIASKIASTREPSSRIPKGSCWRHPSQRRPLLQVHMFNTTDTIVYFSMEIGLDTAIPTYSGGLGVLAGDTLRAAADLGLPMVAVTLLHRRGYFRQRLDLAGNQLESPVVWVPEEVLEPMSSRVTIAIEGRS